MGDEKIEIEIVTPQFTRPKGEPGPACVPTDWEALRSMDRQALKELGLRAWNNPDKPDDDDVAAFGRRGVLMLFPGEWYSSIPSGFEIVGLMGEAYKFDPGGSDNDIRFGCLAYGIVVQLP